MKDLFRGEDKENFSSNVTQFRPKYQEMTYLTNISSKLKKDLSEKALEKLHNYTPQSKKAVRTPKNNNITAGKTINNRIKNILAVTPKK